MSASCTACSATAHRRARLVELGRGDLAPGLDLLEPRLRHPLPLEQHLPAGDLALRLGEPGGGEPLQGAGVLQRDLRVRRVHLGEHRARPSPGRRPPRGCAGSARSPSRRGRRPRARGPRRSRGRARSRCGPRAASRGRRARPRTPRAALPSRPGRSTRRGPPRARGRACGCCGPWVDSWSGSKAPGIASPGGGPVGPARGARSRRTPPCDPAIAAIYHAFRGASKRPSLRAGGRIRAGPARAGGDRPRNALRAAPCGPSS